MSYEIKPEGWTWGWQELVGKAVHAATPQRTSPAQKWVAVMDTFQVGSGTALAMCKYFGVDPFKAVDGVQCGNCTEET